MREFEIRTAKGGPLWGVPGTSFPENVIIEVLGNGISVILKAKPACYNVSFFKFRFERTPRTPARPPPLDPP